MAFPQPAGTIAYEPGDELEQFICPGCQNIDSLYYDNCPNCQIDFIRCNDCSYQSAQDDCTAVKFIFEEGE